MNTLPRVNFFDRRFQIFILADLFLFSIFTAQAAWKSVPKVMVIIAEEYV